MQCAHLTVSQNCQTVLADCQNCLAKQFLPKLWQKLTWSQNNFWYPTPTLNCLNAIFWRLAMNLGNEPDIVQYLLCMIEFVSNEVFFFNPEKFWRGYFLILLWLLSCLLSTIPAIEKSFYPVPWILAWRKCSSCKVGSFIMSEKGKKWARDIKILQSEGFFQHFTLSNATPRLGYRVYASALGNATTEPQSKYCGDAVSVAEHSLV